MLSACSTAGNYQNLANMRGKSADFLIKQWGKPSLVMHSTDGNTTYVYIQEVPSYLPNPPSNNPTTIVVKDHAIAANVPPPGEANTKILKCSAIFKVNKQNYIVAAESRGNCLPSSQ